MECLVLYHDPTSEPSRAVHWFAHEAGIKLAIEHVWLTRGEHRSPQFLAINSSHQVPVLRHGELCLAEASAIMIYLAEISDVQDRWIGNTPEKRARTFQYLSWHHTNTRSAITLNYFLPVLLMPAYKGTPPPDVETVKVLQKSGKESLRSLNSALCDRGAFLGGDQPSIADFFIASDLFALDADPARDEWFADCQVVSDWLENLRKRDGYSVSHSHWNAIIPRVRELILSNPGVGSDPGWVADYIETSQGNSKP